MAASLQIEILKGATRGNRSVHAESPVTFGREPDNMVVMTDPTVSRHQGRFELRDDRWYLVNLSANGTQLGARRVKRRAVRVMDHDVISVADDGILEVRLIESDLPTAPPSGSAPSEAERVNGGPPASAEASDARRRVRLWMGIGIFWVVCLIFMAIGASLRDDGHHATRAAAIMTPEQIEAAIRKLPTVPAPDPRRASELRQAAREAWAKHEVEADGHYRAHRDFQLALAYSGRSSFEDPMDGLLFRDIEDLLIDEVTRRYKRACAYLKDSQYDRAERAFNSLQDFYSDVNSEIFKNIDAQRNAIVEQRKHQPGRRR